MYMKSNQFLALSNAALKYLVFLQPCSSIKLCSADLSLSSYLILSFIYIYVSSRVKPSIVEDIKMVAGFDGRHQYVG